MDQVSRVGQRALASPEGVEIRIVAVADGQEIQGRKGSGQEEGGGTPEKQTPTLTLPRRTRGGRASHCRQEAQSDGSDDENGGKGKPDGQATGGAKEKVSRGVNPAVRERHVGDPEEDERDKNIAGVLLDLVDVGEETVAK